MMIRADVKCYYCGHVSGQLEGDPDNPYLRWTFYSVPGPAPRTLSTRRAIRCIRCGGPVFLDEIETVRPQPDPVDHPVVRATS